MGLKRNRKVVGDLYILVAKLNWNMRVNFEILKSSDAIVISVVVFFFHERIMVDWFIGWWYDNSNIGRIYK